MLHADKWCRISAIDSTKKEVFPPLRINRIVDNWCRIGATHSVLSCRGHHHNDVTTAAMAPTTATAKARRR